MQIHAKHLNGKVAGYVQRPLGAPYEIRILRGQAQQGAVHQIRFDKAMSIGDSTDSYVQDQDSDREHGSYEILRQWVQSDLVTIWIRQRF